MALAFNSLCILPVDSTHALPITGQGIRKLIKTNFVLRKPPTVHSRSRVRRRDLAKRKVCIQLSHAFNRATPILRTMFLRGRLFGSTPFTHHHTTRFSDAWSDLLFQGRHSGLGKRRGSSEARMPTKVSVFCKALVLAP